jgi:TonB-linked SusC/RagA family outer membrane protein
MRLTTVILIATLMQVSAATFGQRITLHQRNTALKSVLKEIRKQSGYDFYYDGKLIQDNQKVTINLENSDLENALHVTFKNLNLTYDIDGKIISIKRKEEPFIFEKLIDRFQAIDIRGKVVDEKGQPLVGASVSIKGGRGTTTDKEGNFYLAEVDEKAVLMISFIGYLTKEVNSHSDLSSIVLELSNSKLDEVQVIAYGQTSQRLNTGDVSTVKATDIEKQPVVNPLLTLQGRVTGLFITQNSGLSGGGVNPLIQGKNSLQYGTDPLIVIDGVSYPSELLPGINNGLLGLSGNNLNSGQGSPLNFINSQDIESISVLKDAGATSIYGSRAANGVILITTKKGKSGQTKIDINLQSGIGKLARKLQLLNTEQYLEMRHQAIKNDVIDLNADPYNQDFYKYFFFKDLTKWSQTDDTDWQDVLLGGTAHYNDFQGTVSGGSANTQFLVGGNYHKETSVFPGSQFDKKGSLHFNINNVSNDQRFHLTLSGSYQADNNNLIGTDFTNLALTLPPNAPALYNSDGSLNWEPSPTGSSTWNNPLAELYNKYTINTNNLISSGVIAYEIISGLTIKSNFGYNNLQSTESTIGPLIATAPETRATGVRSAQFGTNNITSWSAEPQLDYSFSALAGRIDLLLGSSFQQNIRKGFIIASSGYSSDELLTDIGAATKVSPPSVIHNIYRYNAIFGRLNYNLNDKYILNLSIRRDGSSRFGSKNQLHNFSSAAGAWIFSNETFIKQLFPFLSFGKLRASYGTTGNDQIGDYQYLSLYNPITFGVGSPYQNSNNLIANGLSNPYLQWEETNKLQFGGALGFFKDRILLDAAYFRNRSSNQLLNYNLPYTTGFSGIIENFPAKVQNYGWEFSLNTTNVTSKNLNWNSSINLTIPKNKLLAFPNLSTSSYANSLIIGQPITITKLYHYMGVNSNTGLYEFSGSDGLPTSDPGFGTENQQTIVNTAPKYYGGFQNSLSYRNFSLDFLLQFVKQKTESNYYGNFPGGPANQPATILNAWQKAGDNSKIQQYSTYLAGSASLPQFYLLSSDAVYTDASYIRLKNLSFSYQLPTKVKSALKLTDCRIYLQGQNLLTITNYPGLDPEVRGISSLPPLRVITLGIHATL